jgi:DNA-binding MarR family transcriptional regulator
LLLLARLRRDRFGGCVPEMSLDPPDDLDFFLTLTLAASKAWPLIQREFRAAGVDASNWGLLFHVGAREDVTPSELAAETGISATTIRDQVQSLVDRGLLKREANPQDARSYLLRLTSRGRRELDRGLEASQRARDLVSENLGDLEPLRQSLFDLVVALTELNDRADVESRAARVGRRDA